MATPALALDFSNFAEVYEQKLVGPIFRPWAELILNRLELREGDRLLDIACGTGIVARLGRERIGAGGRVVGVDANPQMLAVARAVDPGVEWREGNAVSLPVVEGEQYEVVTCHQGLQFFPDRAQAAAEMRRALVPGGRIAVGTWAAEEQVPLFGELRRAAERHVGPIVDQRYSFGDADALEKLLRDAGFDEVRVEVLSRDVRFAEWDLFANLNAMALVGMSARGKTMTPDERTRTVEAIVQDSHGAMTPYLRGRELIHEMFSNIATARG